MKKVNENYSHELKPASTTTKMKVAKVRAEPKTIGTANVNAAAMLPWRAAGVTNSAFYSNRVMQGGSVATSIVKLMAQL